jgi:uncharacterized protein (UPF0248 family)
MKIPIALAHAALSNCVMLLLLLMRTSTAFRMTRLQSYPSQQQQLLLRNHNYWGTTIATTLHHYIFRTREMSGTTARRGNLGNLEKSTALEQFNMENIYQKWTLNEDKILWENRFESTTIVASLLGRGLRGTEQRLAKLRSIDSPAYLRLFAGKNPMEITKSDDPDAPDNVKKKLTPSSEVLRRIQWDDTLPSNDFSVVHYDRVDDKLVETPIDAPNQSISGNATKFIDALPEHRIMAIKYKARVVWDRTSRVECVFSGEGIVEVIRTYDVWKKKKDDEDENERQRREYIATRLQQVLGMERFYALETLWTKMNDKFAKDPTLSIKLEAEKYIKSSLDLFTQVWSEPEVCSMPQWIPSSDMESLEMVSELVVLYPDTKIRSSILDEISIAMMKAEGKLKPTSTRGRKLPELNEKELTETFIRGSGPGGQKVNKTSNRVCLVHDPTQLRVECQETRSLVQNRKIARKRLQEKLDEYLNGSQSKANMDAERAAMKKIKAKARSRARVREKQRPDDGTDADNSDDDFE